MIKRMIAAAVLITAIGLLAGCGTTGKESSENNKVQEITLVDAQQNQNEQTELQTQENVQSEQTEVQTQENVQNETQNQDNAGNDAQNQNNGQNDTQRKNKKENSSQSQVSISLEKAKALALDRVSGATENDVWIELDYDDGHYVYEGEILYGQKEYEFEIDANTGTFLEWSEERR